MEKHPTRVLVAPLDWGLGHATRCIPVIRELLELKVEVLLSASGSGAPILKKNFPRLPFIDLPGIQISYPENQYLVFSLLGQLPGIWKSMRKEHQQLEKAIDTYQITHVISDNRYGMYSDKIKSAFISHQLHIQTGNTLSFVEPFLFELHKKRIQKFNELWIPDQPYPNNLSGKLSKPHGITIPVKHLGILSRFRTSATPSEKIYDCIALLSGPEPQRTLLEQKMFSLFQTSEKKCLIVQGKPSDSDTLITGNITCFPTISEEELQNLLHPETLLICRPGYSTLMDLDVLRHVKVLFIPTPGQTEQEYLAEEMKNKYGYAIVNQKDEITLDAIASGNQLPFSNDQSSLKKVIGEFISS